MPTYRGTMDATQRRTRYTRLVGSLENERSTFESHWRELGDYFVPRRTRFWAGDRNKGDKRNQNIINSAGRFAARTLESGLHAGLTSPARPWLKLTIPDKDLATFGPVERWLEECARRLLTIFNVSNTYNMLPICYGDLGVFGTAAIGLFEDRDDILRAQSYPIGSYAVGTDVRGVVTTFTRKYEMTCRQIVEQFGVTPNGRDINWARISRAVQDCWENGDYETAFEVQWLICPNPDARRDRLEAKYLPFLSLHWETGASDPGKEFLRESGFREFPIMVPRWAITGEDSYGTDCPGMTSLGDNKQLQIMERRHGQALNKMVDPPLVGPPSLRTQKTSLLPGDITYAEEREGQKGLRAIHEIRIDLQHLAQNLGAVEFRIKRAFYEDLFLMLATTDPYRGADAPTAREVSERHEEKLLALGPVLERVNDELLDPMIDRAFALLDQAGLIPEPPPEIEGMDLRPEYTSILAQAQKLVGVSSTDRFLGTMAPLLEAFPEVRNKIDAFALVNDYAERLGVNPKIIKSDEDAQQATAAQQKQQADQAQAEQAAMIAKTARDGAAAPMGTDSALDRVLAGFGAR